jgi:hypothetical protein
MKMIEDNSQLKYDVIKISDLRGILIEASELNMDEIILPKKRNSLNMLIVEKERIEKILSMNNTCGRRMLEGLNTAED